MSVLSSSVQLAGNEEHAEEEEDRGGGGAGEALPPRSPPPLSGSTANATYPSGGSCASKTAWPVAKALALSPAPPAPAPPSSARRCSSRSDAESGTTCACDPDGKNSSDDREEDPETTSGAETFHRLLSRIAAAPSGTLTSTRELRGSGL